MTPLTEKKIKTPKEKAVFDHVVNTGHNASFDDFETLAKKREFRLLLKKLLLILRNDPRLNRYVKSISLELFS